MINCVSHFKEVLGKAEAEQNTTSCWNFAKLLKKHLAHLSQLKYRQWGTPASLPSQTARVHGEQEAQFCVQGDGSCVTIPGQSTGLQFVCYPSTQRRPPITRASLSKPKFSSRNFWANKDATHLYCRNSLFGKAALDWQRSGTCLPRTWRRSATSRWLSSRPSTTRWAWSWRGTVWRGCGDEVPCVHPLGSHPHVHQIWKKMLTRLCFLVFTFVVIIIF